MPVPAAIPHGRRTLAATAAATLIAPAGGSAQQAPRPVAPRPAASEGMLGRVAGLRLGANLERWFPIAANNHARRLGVGWFAELRAAGFDHVRMFVPRVEETGDGAEVPGLFREATADAVAAGLTVLLGLADFYHDSSPWDETAWRAWDRRARLLADGTDPARVALAPLNEPAFADTAGWRPVRDRLLGRLRQAAPRHTLAWGGREWCSWRSLLEMEPPADRNTLAEVHDYQGGDTSAVEWRFNDVAAWRAKHGVPVIVSELGGALSAGENVPAWAADLRQALPVLARLKLPATLWAFTHGGSWRLQDGEAARPKALLAAAIAGRR
jgi:Cellulase (glycosyl hydrolase family 5)